MVSLKNISAQLNRITDVPSSDPDDARRRKLLNILLTGIAILSILTIFVVLLSYAFDIIKNTNDVWLGLGAAIGLLFGAAIFWLLNRSQKIPGWVASFLFLLFLMVIFSFSDSKVELANGRSLFIFTIPIIMSSILLTPSSSFIFAFLNSIELSLLARAAGTATNTFAMVGFFLVAFITWLSSRSLEQTLREIRDINTNLDQIVKERLTPWPNPLGANGLRPGAVRRSWKVSRMG
jgi:HAMP domain-containing protein